MWAEYRYIKIQLNTWGIIPISSVVIFQSLVLRSIVLGLMIDMKKLLDSDLLRAVQFKCNTSANYTS